MNLKAKLLVVGGDAKATEIDLKLPTVIGRGREATLTLPHPLVSRRHCELYEAEGQLMVRDLGSLNGTFIANERISEAALPPGELLTVGAVTFRAVYGESSEEDDVDRTMGVNDQTVRDGPVAPAAPAVEFEAVDNAPPPEPVDVDENELLGDDNPPEAEDADMFPPGYVPADGNGTPASADPPSALPATPPTATPAQPAPQAAAPKVDDETVHLPQASPPDAEPAAEGDAPLAQDPPEAQAEPDDASIPQAQAEPNAEPIPEVEAEVGDEPESRQVEADRPGEAAGSVAPNSGAPTAQDTDEEDDDDLQAFLKGLG